MLPPMEKVHSLLAGTSETQFLAGFESVDPMECEMHFSRETINVLQVRGSVIEMALAPSVAQVKSRGEHEGGEPMPLEDPGGQQQEAVKEMQPPAKTASKLEAFGFVRFAAALHVMGHHALQTTHRFWMWGAVWVPFFFIRSGFVLTYAQQNKPNDVIKWQTFMWRRVTSIYPLYVCSLMLILPLLVLGKSKAAGHWPSWLFLGQWGFVIPFDVVLLQSWLPFPASNWVNGPSWYLSALASFWLFWLIFYSYVKDLSSRGCWIALFCLMFVTGLKLFVYDLTIYGYNMFKGCLYNVLPNLNIFLSGMVLARLFAIERSIAEDEKALMLRTANNYGATLGCAGLLAVFFLPVEENIWWTCRAGLLIPLQLLFVWGLAVGTDPLARLFSRKWLAATDLISYGMYIIHWGVLDIERWLLSRTMSYGDSDATPSWARGEWGVKLTFWAMSFPATVLLTILLNNLVNAPVQKCIARSS